MVCTSSFDGHVSVFSLMGGSASGQDFHQQKVSALESQSEQGKNDHLDVYCLLLSLWQYFEQ